MADLSTYDIFKAKLSLEKLKNNIFVGRRAIIKMQNELEMHWNRCQKPISTFITQSGWYIWCINTLKRLKENFEAIKITNTIKPASHTTISPNTSRHLLLSNFFIKQEKTSGAKIVWCVLNVGKEVVHCWSKALVACN